MRSMCSQICVKFWPCNSTIPLSNNVALRSAMATGPGHFWQDLYSLFQAPAPLGMNWMKLHHSQRILLG